MEGEKRALAGDSSSSEPSPDVSDLKSGLKRLLGKERGRMKSEERMDRVGGWRTERQDEETGWETPLGVRVRRKEA